jgi:CRISPR-associated protein Csx10
MIVITYRVTLLQPLLATSPQGDPNSSVSFDYIPGSLIRGALINHYMRQNQLSETEVVTDTTWQRLFLSGTVRYLHAYPFDRNKQRTLPTPRSMLRRKNDELMNEKRDGEKPERISVFNASHAYWNEDRRRNAENGDTLKPISKPFYAISEAGIVRFYDPARTISIHIQRDSRKGRALRESGQVFQYDALAAGQWFGGIVLADSSSDADEIETLLRKLQRCWIGRSRSANYGQVAISQVKQHDDDDDEPWREYPSDGEEYADLSPGKDIIHNLTFLSDTLLYDQNGNPIAQLDAKTLAGYLRLPEDAITLDTVRTFTAIERVGGFNRAWCMPLPQNYAIAAGSVVSFTLKYSLTAAKARELEQQGIGERRAEGFGRIAFNIQQSSEVPAYASDVYHEMFTTDEEMPEQAPFLARRMARRLLAQELERKIIAYVNTNLSLQSVYNQLPPNSQLARVRVLVRRALPRGDVALVLDEFNRFKTASREQFDRSQFRGQSLSTWITTLLEQPERVWFELDNFSAPPVAEYEAPRDSANAALRLLYAVLTTSMRLRDQEEEVRA